MHRILLPLLFALLGASALPALARDTRYISDEVFVVLHTGPGREYRWVTKLNPGDRLEVSQVSADGEWAQVTTSGGTEGWVTTEFLTAAPPAQVQLPLAESRAQRLATQKAELEEQVKTLRAENAQLQQGLDSSTGELGDIADELARLKQISGNAVQLDVDNRRLIQETENLRSELEMLEAERQRLSDKLESEDFINGALAVLLGVIITLVVPRLWPKRRRSSEWA